MADTRHSDAAARETAVPNSLHAGIAPGVGCLFAAALCMARTSDALPGLSEHGELSAAVCGLLGGVVLVVLALLALGVRLLARRTADASVDGRDAAGEKQPGSRTRPLLAGALCLVGIAGIAALECGALPHDPGAPLAQAAACVAGALTGAGIALLACVWADAVAYEKPVLLMRRAAQGMAIAAICYALFRYVAGVAASCCLLALYTAVSAGLCFRAVQNAADSVGANDQVSATTNRGALLTAMADGGTRVACMPMGSVRLRDLYRMLWIALVGVLLSAFIVGLTWDPEAAYETSLRSSATSTWGPLAGALLACAGVLAATRGRDDEGCLRLLSSVFLPIALALVLVAPVVRQTTPDQLVQLCCSIASTAGFALFTLAGFAELILAARLVGASPGAAVGGALAAIALCVWAGFAAIGVWGTNGRVICLLFEAALLTAVAISYALRPRGTAGKTDAGSGPGPSGNPNAPHDTRCADLAARGALSQREAEVLAYLARGHGSAFIASELGISENTVRTHTRHIYEKLGISSREELLALVNGPAN